MSGYVPWWIVFIDAGDRVQCQLCDTVEPLSPPPLVATLETEAFISRHMACGGDAA